MYYWENPDSLSIKLAIIQHSWGEKIPTYLWYHLGSDRVPSRWDIDEIAEQLFPRNGLQPGSVEVHESLSIPGTFELRIRDAESIAPTVTVVGGERRHLIRFGEASDDGRSGNFHRLWHYTP